MKPSVALRAHRTELRQLAERHGLLRPRIFGSVLHGDDEEGGDLALLVDPSPSTTLLTLGGMELDAEKLLGMKVDVLTPNALPRRVREQILGEAAPL